MRLSRFTAIACAAPIAAAVACVSPDDTRPVAEAAALDTTAATAALTQLRTDPFDSDAWVESAMTFGALGLRGTRDDPLCVENPTNTTAHDGQRLIVADGGNRELGPLVAILVDARRLEQTTDFAQGAVIACMLNQGDRNYAPMEYAPLSIPPGYSCLWVQGGATETEWQAELRPIVDGIGTCSQTATASLLAKPLRIEDNTQPRIYPSTGRWMWDSQNRLNFIGIRCGNAWCEIGPTAGFTGTHSIANSSLVPGRWDEQYLAYAAPTGTLVLSDILGRIEPGPDLPAVARSPVPNEEYVPAHVTLTGGTPAQRRAYLRKHGLEESAADPRPVRFVKKASAPGMGWEARPDQKAAFAAVTRSPHLHATDDVVRFAWSEDDEDFWVPCENGCCKVRGVKSGS